MSCSRMPSPPCSAASSALTDLPEPTPPLPSTRDPRTGAGTSADAAPHLVPPADPPAALVEAQLRPPGHLACADPGRLALQALHGNAQRPQHQARAAGTPPGRRARQMISTTTMGDSYKQLGTVRRCPVRLASAAPRDQPMTPPSAWPASVFASSGPWLAGSSAGPDGW